MNRIDQDSSDDHQELVGEFLLRRLHEVGLTHLFGVAGDFNLEFLEQLENFRELQWVGCCNELNAAYAADGYARTLGLSCLVTTYGVGELSALCGIAGAFSEHLSVVSIVGSPPLSEVERRSLLHHTAGDGDFDNMLACGREFSVAQARLLPHNAVTEIDRCLRACILQKKPVYLQLPSDIAYLRIRTPTEPLKISFESDQQMLKEFAKAAAQRIETAASVAILLDADVARYGQAEKVRSLAAKLSCPIAVMGTAKGVIDETDPAYLGVYSGRFSEPETKLAIESADCLIQLSVRFIDSTTDSFTEHIHPERSIKIDALDGHVDVDDFQGIWMGDMLASLLATVASRPARERPRKSVPPRIASPSKLSQAWFWQRMAAFVQPDDIVVAENGTSLSGVTAMPLPTRTQVICQALWGAIGYSLPAAFGSLMAAPHRRHVLFIGDGSFQLTVQELSSVLRHHLKPIIFLINNDGYTVERLILGRASSYNDIQPWNYAALCGVFAAGADFDSRCVSSVGQLEEALQAAGAANSCIFIEVMMDRMDAPEALRKLGAAYAKQDYVKNLRVHSPENDR
jgi:indolepyruvate decarboxylase